MLCQTTKTEKTTWNLVMNVNGRIFGQNPVTAPGYTSSAFYRDKDGHITYPLGT